MITAYSKLNKFTFNIIQANQQNFSDLFPSSSFIPRCKATEVMERCLQQQSIRFLTSFAADLLRFPYKTNKNWVSDIN